MSELIRDCRASTLIVRPNDKRTEQPDTHQASALSVSVRATHIDERPIKSTAQRDTDTRYRWRSRTCRYCKQEFKAARADAVFCGVNCRKAYKRWLDRLDDVGSMSKQTIRSLKNIKRYLKSERTADAEKLIAELIEVLHEAIEDLSS